jgi:hypothetical protein
MKVYEVGMNIQFANGSALTVPVKHVDTASQAEAEAMTGARDMTALWHLPVGEEDTHMTVADVLIAMGIVGFEYVLAEISTEKAGSILTLQ